MHVAIFPSMEKWALSVIMCNHLRKVNFLRKVFQAEKYIFSFVQVQPKPKSGSGFETYYRSDPGSGSETKV